MKDLILFGDCRKTIPTITEPVKMCVTSPPYYGLRDYGGEDNQIGQENSPEEFVDQLVEVFRSVKEVLTDDGTLWLNIGDSYYNYRPGKGQSYPKQSVSKTKQDLPDKCNKRGNKLQGLKEKDLIGIPWMLAFALRKDGWYLRQDIIWNKPNPMPESVKDRCTKSHEYIFLLSKSKNYYYDNEAIKEPTKESEAGSYSGVAKGNTTKNKRSVWTVNKKPYKGAHFATFPSELIEPCIKAGSQKGDIILDPFIGSGTTAMVAKSLGRHYIGCELHESYNDLIQNRVSQYTINLEDFV